MDILFGTFDYSSNHNKKSFNMVHYSNFQDFFVVTEFETKISNNKFLLNTWSEYKESQTQRLKK